MARFTDEESRWLVGQVRQERRPVPQPIADVLSKLMVTRGYANEQLAREWVEIWTQAAGMLADRTRAGRFSRGVLEITVQDSATLQELSFQRRQLLRTVKQLAPQLGVKDLRFKVGNVR